jgi:apolipoprotein N-acyltransferase
MFMQRVKVTARSENIYLAVAPFIDHGDEHQLNENKMIIISPEDEELLIHYKFGGSSIEGSVPGDAILRITETDYGLLSGVVCWDQDFPHIMKQAGKLGVDVMLAPNANWKAITPMHTHIGIFRAVENGYSLVRPNVNGLSVITDPLGRVIASMDHDKSSEWVLIAQVPTRGIRTIYSIIGDLFGWAALAAFSGLVIYALFLSRSKRFRTSQNKL